MELNLTPTLGDSLLPGDLLYDGPHRGVVIERRPYEVGGTARHTHYEVVGDTDDVYHIALESDTRYLVARGFVDIIAGPAHRRVP